MHLQSTLLTAASLVLVTALLAGCGGKSAGKPPEAPRQEAPPAAAQAAPAAKPASGKVTVEMNKMKFFPEVIEIAAGTTVTFVNKDPEADHSVWEGDPKKQGEAKWKSPDLKEGESFSYTFDTPGTVEIYCQYDSHFLQGMKAKVVVK
ncbi:MAG: cupredoxin domain-containing protein [Bacillota bacterium]